VVLISPRMLLDRIRHPRSRADDLAALRARFRATPSRLSASESQRAMATRLRELRVLLSEAFASVEACHGCAKGHPLPSGRWDGGHCCGGKTLDIWSPEEVFALKLAGVSATSLAPPAGDHAGCAFRGPTGCSLTAADRPSICVRYVCFELRAELKETPEWKRISALAREIRETQTALARTMSPE